MKKGVNKKVIWNKTNKILAIILGILILIMIIGIIAKIIEIKNKEVLLSPDVNDVKDVIKGALEAAGVDSSFIDKITDSTWYKYLSRIKIERGGQEFKGATIDLGDGWEIFGSAEEARLSYNAGWGGESDEMRAKKLKKELETANAKENVIGKDKLCNGLKEGLLEEGDEGFNKDAEIKLVNLFKNQQQYSQVISDLKKAQKDNPNFDTTSADELIKTIEESIRRTCNQCSCPNDDETCTVSSEKPKEGSEVAFKEIEGYGVPAIPSCACEKDYIEIPPGERTSESQVAITTESLSETTQ